MMKMRKNNAGITLLELIVVITILGILAGAVTVSLGLLNSVTASGCAESIDSKLEQVKTMSMSKENEAYLVLYRKDDGYYVACTSKVSPFASNPNEDQKLGDNRMSIKVTMDTGETAEVGDQLIYLTFDRASGAILPCSVSAEGEEPVKKSSPTSIIIEAKGRTSTIEIVAQTGKHYVE